MAVETLSRSEPQVISVENRVRNVNAEALTPSAASTLAAEYFQEEYDLFQKRFLAIRDKVNPEVGANLDQQALGYARVYDSIAMGDNRSLKQFTIVSAMEINKQALSEGRGYSAFGKNLYAIGSLMTSIAR